MNWLTAKRWSPYQVGLLIGVLCWIAFYVSDRPLGASTAFVQSAAMIEKAALPDHYAEKEYFKDKKYAPEPGWEWMLVVGVFAGALFSSLISRDFRAEAVPDVWRNAMGRSALLRLFFAFIGGVLVLFGARLAGGCTSGHGISGGLQLAVGSWAFMGAFFLTGIIAACLIYRTRKAPVQQQGPQR